MTNNYAYITLLTSDNYAQGALLLKASLDKVNTKYPLICLITKSVSTESRNRLSKFGINLKEVENIRTPDSIYQHNLMINERQANIWKDVLTKFQVFTYTEFDKIILLDCDIMVMKNLDHCFEYENMTAALDGEIFNLWPRWPHFNSGFLVLKPNLEEYEKIINFANTFDSDGVVNGNGEPYVIADQELLNLYYSDWSEKKELHLNKWYNIFPPHLARNHEDEILKNAYFIHFVGIKPWQISDDNISPLLYTELCDERGYKSYAIAFAMIQTIYRHNFEHIDWNDPEIEFEQIRYEIEILRNNFSDIEGSIQILQEYKSKTSDKEKRKKCNEVLAYNQRLLDDKKRCELLLPALKRLYSETCISGKPSLDLYSSIALLEKGSKHPENYLCVEQYWDILVNSL